MARMVRKKGEGASAQVAVVIASKVELGIETEWVLDWCECGNIVTPRASSLQDAAKKKKCIKCLASEMQASEHLQPSENWT